MEPRLQGLRRHADAHLNTGLDDVTFVKTSPKLLLAQRMPRQDLLRKINVAKQ